MIDLDELDRLEVATRGKRSWQQYEYLVALRSAARYLIDEARQAVILRLAVQIARSNSDRINAAINDCRLDTTRTDAEIIAEWREVARVHGTVVEGANG